MERWTAVRTHSQAERWAEKNLRQAGYVTYLPLGWVRRRDRVVPNLWHRIQAPLFSGYVFVRHDPDSSWSPIREAPGVRGLVKSGAQLSYASDMAVERLQRALDGVEAVSGVALPDRAVRRPGDAVSVRTGPLAELPGVVLEVGRDTALVSLLMFGMLREVTVAQNNLVDRAA